MLQNLSAARQASVVHVIDGDLMVYRATHVAQQSSTVEPEDGSPPVEYRTLSAESVKSYCEETVQRLKAPPGGLTVVALSSPINFRRLLFPEYKSNRTSPKPLGLEWVRQYVKATYRVEEVERLEADDVLGLYATHPDLKHKVWLFSDDKDMKTVPCRLRCMDGFEVGTISVGTAVYWHYYQTLVGDAADGYPGCPGIGPKGAEKALGPPTADPDPKTAWAAVVKAYESKGLSERDAVRSACMAKILLWDDIQAEWPKIRLWEPPK